MPANMRNLPCHKVLGIQENKHDYHIDVETLHAPTCCPHCRSASFVGFGRREQMVKDLPMHARRVGLYIDTRRYRCRTCGKAFYEALPDIDEKRLMTKRLAQWMGKQSVRRTFTSIAEEVGGTEFTVRAVFSDYVNELKSPSDSRRRNGWVSTKSTLSSRVASSLTSRTTPSSNSCRTGTRIP